MGVAGGTAMASGEVLLLLCYGGGLLVSEITSGHCENWSRLVDFYDA